MSNDFYGDFLRDPSLRKDPETKYSVVGNRWDVHTRERIAKQVKQFNVARDQLGAAVPSTGYEALTDSLLAFYKASPELKTEGVRPSFAINRAVMAEMMDLKEYQTLHNHCSGDPVATGLAAAEIEPTVEIIFDKLEGAQQSAQRLEELLQQMERTAEQIDELMASIDELSSEQEQQLQDLQAFLEQLKGEAESENDGLQDEISKSLPEISKMLAEAMEEVNEGNAALSAFEMWGLTGGSIKKMNASARLELAKKLRTEKFKRMAEVIGRMQQIAFNEQVLQTDAPTEIYDITRGDDLPHMIPSELLFLSDPILKFDFLHRLVEKQLSQYDLQGQETVNKGGIAVLLDSSGSMSGDRSIWAKGIALALLKIAQMQHREIWVVEFSGVGQYLRFDFDTSTSEIKMTPYVGERPGKPLRGPEAIMAYAEAGLGGGTSFRTPLTVALERFREEYAATGAVSGDIVFLTDGQAYDTDEPFMAEFKAEQARLGFNVFGIAIGSEAEREPLNSICDGQVINLKQLTDERDLTPLFAQVTRR